MERFGYNSFENIKQTPILDIVDGVSNDQFRKYLERANQTDKKSHASPRHSIQIKTRSGSLALAECVGHRAVFEGEEVIELQLYTIDDLKLATRIKEFPWRLCFSILCLALLVIAPNVLLTKLNVNNTPKTFLPPDAPSVIADDTVRAVFPDDEVILLLFEGVALFSDGFLKAYSELSEELENHEWIEDVITVTNQDHISGSDDGFLVEPLINMEALDELSPKERQMRAIEDRFARNSLVATDGSALALVIIPLALEDSVKHLALENDVLKLVEEYHLSGYLTAMAGEITTDAAQMKFIQHDNMIFIPAILLAGLLLIWLLFHRLIALITTALVTMAVVGSTMAGYVIFQQPFNSISGIIPPLLSALTIAALIHFYNALHYAARHGLSGEDRVNAALGEIRRPALFSALTTSAGLASLGLSTIPPIRMFGLISAVGVFVIYLIVIHLLPPIFAKFDRHEWPHHKSGMALMDKLVRLFFHLGIRRPVIVISSILIILAAGTPYILKIQVETNVHEFFRPDHELRRATDHIEQKLVGTIPLEIMLMADEPGRLVDPDVLNYIKDFQRWLESQPEIDKAISIADFIEEMHWGFNAEDPDFRSIPDDPELITQYLFVYDGEDIYDFINEEYDFTRIPLNLNVHGANDISRVMEKASDYLKRRLPEGLSWDIAGGGRMFADQEDLLIGGQVKSLVGALALIFILMLILWRSVKDALICMIPNMSPILLIFILMGILGIWLDMATAMIASVAVGIAIDDTIHLYHGFIRRVRAGCSPVYALARTYRQAGRAVMTTTVILCSQFLLLMFSAFVPMNSFGLLTSIGLVAALFFDALLLPALLIVIFGKRKGKNQALI